MWVSGADLLLGCLVLVKRFDRTAYSSRNLNIQLFLREILLLVLFNFWIFESSRFRPLNATVEVFAYGYVLHPTRSTSSVLTLNIQLRFEVWSMGTEQDLLNLKAKGERNSGRKNHPHTKCYGYALGVFLTRSTEPYQTSCSPSLQSSTPGKGFDSHCCNVLHNCILISGLSSSEPWSLFLVQGEGLLWQ